MPHVNKEEKAIFFVEHTESKVGKIYLKKQESLRNDTDYVFRNLH